MKKLWVPLMIIAGMVLASPVAADPSLFIWHPVGAQFSEAQSVYAIDLDGDSHVDVVGACAGNNEIAWWENDGSQQFSKHSVDSGFSDAQSVYSTDVTGDGNLDILGASSGRNEIALWENGGGGTTAIELVSFSARPAKAPSILGGLTWQWQWSVIVGLCVLFGVVLCARLRRSQVSMPTSR
jgi:hypothetical protein